MTDLQFHALFLILFAQWVDYEEGTYPSALSLFVALAAAICYAQILFKLLELGK